MKSKLAVTAALLILLQTQDASASTAERSIFSFHAYGTLGVAHSDEEDADFVASINKPNGAGYSHDWDFGVDSRLAFQIDAQLTQKLSAVVQVISERVHHDKYGPDVEWANIKYQMTPDLSVRAGRVVMPFMMLSDFRKVGYTTPWIRPPVELYGQIPINNTDGFDVTYRLRLGEVTATFQGVYGSISGEIPVAKFEARDMLDINASVEYGSTTLRIGYFQQKLTAHLPTEPLFDAFDGFGATLESMPSPTIQSVGAEARAIADRYQSIGKRYRLVSVGANYDDGDWLGMAEWTQARGHSIVRDTTAWYGTVGRRFGSVTAYTSYAREREESAKSDPGLTVANLPQGALSGAAEGLNAGLNGVLTFLVTGQKTTTVGLRWDFVRNAALKLQYDRISLDPGSAGFLTNIQPGFERGGVVQVVGATVDYVF